MVNLALPGSNFFPDPIWKPYLGPYLRTLFPTLFAPNRVTLFGTLFGSPPFLAGRAVLPHAGLAIQVGDTGLFAMVCYGDQAPPAWSTKRSEF